MRVFVSSQAVDRPPASLLIARLRAKGWRVEHSPSNPLNHDDPRWSAWYEHGLPSALACVELFIAVVDEAWDSSTWMATEADTARRTNGVGCCSWNPNGIQRMALGMREYLCKPLPPDLEAAVVALGEWMK
jgi:hypothetical protein